MNRTLKILLIVGLSGLLMAGLSLGLSSNQSLA
jgi:hypothetical protein